MLHGYSVEKFSNPWREQSIISVFVYQIKSMSCWIFEERERERERVEFENIKAQREKRLLHAAIFDETI